MNEGQRRGYFEELQYAWTAQSAYAPQGLEFKVQGS